MAARIYALVGLVAVTVTTLYPLAFQRPRDSFPLSNYPMFARARTKPHVRLFYFVATTPERKRLYVAPDVVGSPEVLQVRSLIYGTVRRGREATAKLCADVAARLAGDRAYAGAELAIVDGRHDALEFFTEDKLGTERVVARCRVPGQGG